MAFNKIMLGDVTIIDLTADTVTADKLLAGATAHAASGEIITGAIADNAAINDVISTVSGAVTIPSGYYSSAGSVGIDSAEQAKIIPANIKSGISILGVQGSAPDIALTPVTPNGVDITHYWMPKNMGNMYFQITYEDKTNTRSDEYVIQAGHTYLARFLSPYGAKCQTGISTTSLVGNTVSVSGCIAVAPNGFHDYIFFTAPKNGYFVMYKDDTSTDGFQTECFEVTYVSG